MKNPSRALGLQLLVASAALPAHQTQYNENLQKEKDTAMIQTDKLSALKYHVVYYNDFPKKGVSFADFLPILSDPEAFAICIDLLTERYKDQNIQMIVGLESRGFLIGTALAYKLGIGFVPVRKANKLPGLTYQVHYQKEYGTDTFEIAQHALNPGQRVLIIDDLIATGGSAKAAIDLVKKAGANPVEFATVLQVKELAEKINLGIPRFTLIN